MKTVTRDEAIELLRKKCVALVDDEHCLCDVASRMNILCGGFSQWTFAELKERYAWIAKKHPHITRKELEDLANRWQLARQFVSDSELACDNQQFEQLHQICQGWAGHGNEELARFCQELTGEEHSVVGDEAPQDAPSESA